MKKTLFTLIPSLVVLIYTASQFILNSLVGHMYFSSNFIWELIFCIILGLFYFFIAFRLGRSEYIRLAVAGYIIGFVVFILIGLKLFLNFEFYKDLSI